VNAAFPPVGSPGPQSLASGGRKFTSWRPEMATTSFGSATSGGCGRARTGRARCSSQNLPQNIPALAGIAGAVLRNAFLQISHQILHVLRVPHRGCILRREKSRHNVRPLRRCSVFGSESDATNLPASGYSSAVILGPEQALRGTFQADEPAGDLRKRSLKNGIKDVTAAYSHLSGAFTCLNDAHWSPIFA
jgi:hypothetical protein